MRLYITDLKDEIALSMFDFLKRKLMNKEVKVIVNERDHPGVVQNIVLDEEKLNFIELFVDETKIIIPLNDNSRIRLDKGLYFFETEQHTTLIYN